MRSLAVGVLGVPLAGSIVGNAQQPAPPTFRAGTTLVDFTVVAVDARGNPVTDLGKRRAISSPWVLDLINTTLVGQVQLQTELVSYLKQLPPDAHVGLYMLSEHAVAIHDFTQDAQSLRARSRPGDRFGASRRAGQVDRALRIG